MPIPFPVRQPRGMDEGRFEASEDVVDLLDACKEHVVRLSRPDRISEEREDTRAKLMAQRRHFLLVPADEFIVLVHEMKSFLIQPLAGRLQFPDRLSQ